jgi:CheY-like chemotaxis protein
VLIVEDNPADVFITSEALQGQEVDFEIDVVTDGESALAYLLREGKYATAATPDLVLLDLNIPRIPGEEILQTIRKTPALSKLFVVVLSSSPQDIAGAMSAQASHYLQKPSTLDEFLAIGQKIAQLWAARAVVTSP